MKILVVSDTHECSEKDLELIIQLANTIGTKTIIHCGDMIDKHFGSETFKGYTIYVYVTRENENLPKDLPPNWHLLGKKHKLIKINGAMIYIDHYLGRDFQFKTDLKRKDPEVEMTETIIKAEKRTLGWIIALLYRLIRWHKRILFGRWRNVAPWRLVEKIQKKYGLIPWILCGHSHNQSFSRLNGTCIVDPGAFGFGERLYAVIETETKEVSFFQMQS